MWLVDQEQKANLECPEKDTSIDLLVTVFPQEVALSCENFMLKTWTRKLYIKGLMECGYPLDAPEIVKHSYCIFSVCGIICIATLLKHSYHIFPVCDKICIPTPLCSLKREDAKDRERWRRLLCRAAGQPLRKQGKWL